MSRSRKYEARLQNIDICERRREMFAVSMCSPYGVGLSGLQAYILCVVVQVIGDSELGISLQSRRKFKSVHLVFEDVEPTHSTFSAKGAPIRW